MKQRWFVRHFAVLCLAALLLSGCAAAEPKEETVLLPYSEQQMLMLVLSARQETEQLYTNEIWRVTLGSGESYKTRYLRELRDFFLELCALNGMAEERGIRLDTEEKKQLSAAAQIFYESSVRGQEALSGLKPEETEDMFYQYALTLKLKESMLSDRKTEISESEARVVRLEELQAESKEAAEQLRTKAGNGEELKLLAKNNPARQVRLRVLVRGELPKDAEDTLFALEDGAVSEVLSLEGRYSFFRCISSYDEEATAAHRAELQAERLRTVVKEAYEDYITAHRIEMNASRWQSVERAADQDYSGENFFSAVRGGFAHEGA